VQFIPALRELQKHHDVFTNSQFYAELGICPYGDERPDLSIVPMWPSWDKVLKFRLMHPFRKVWGFKYNIKGRPYGWGYNKSVRVDPFIPEILTNAKLVPNDNKYYLEGHEPVRDFYVIGTTNKKHCQIDWDHMEGVFKRRGKTVLRVGEKGVRFNNYRELFDMLRRAERFIGVDSGLMHLADILHIPMVVFWGDPKGGENAIRALPRNRFSLMSIGQEKHWE